MRLFNALLIPLLLVSFPLETSRGAVPRQGHAFSPVDRVACEITVSRTMSSSLAEPHVSTARIRAVRDGDLWGVEKIVGAGEVELVTNLAIRGLEIVRADFLRENGVRSDFTMSMTSERIAGKKVRPIKEQLFPCPSIQIVSMGAFHGKLIDEFFLKGAKQTTIGGNLVSFEKRTVAGLFKATCDSSRGFLPISMTLVQQGRDLHHGRPLNSIDMNGGGIYPKGKVLSCVSKVEDIELEEGNVGWYIKSWKLTETLECAAGPTVTNVQAGQVTAILAGSELKNESMMFDLEIPIREPVYVDETSLIYRWDGIWAVPDTIGLQKYGGDANNGNYLWWAIVSLAVCVAVVCGAFLARRWGT